MNTLISPFAIRLFIPQKMMRLEDLKENLII